MTADNFSSRHLPTRAAAYAEAFVASPDDTLAHRAVWWVGENPAFPTQAVQKFVTLGVEKSIAERIVKAAVRLSKPSETQDDSELDELNREAIEYEWVSSDC